MALERIKELGEMKPAQATEELFAILMEAVENGELEPVLQAKCVCVDARGVTDEEVGTSLTTWSHGKVERENILTDTSVLIRTLGRDGKPVVDELGHENIYVMDVTKFSKKYRYDEQVGHYVQDGTPMATIMIPAELLPSEGLTLLPPNWGGYEGTLVPGGLIMLPFDPSKSKEENIKAWKEAGSKLDWYPNNEVDTYAPCYPDGKFVDEELRKTFKQDVAKKPTKR